MSASTLETGANRLRKRMAFALVRLARRIYPQSKEVEQFWVDRLTEMVITGQSTVKITAVATESKYPAP